MLLNLKSTLFLLTSSLLAFSACGSDDTPQKATADAAPKPETDAAPKTSFSGTISLADVVISNNTGDQVLRGSVANISFSTPEDQKVSPHPDYDTSIGKCKVYVYDVEKGESSAKGTDGGTINIKNTLAGEFDCGYNEDFDKYLCTSTDSAAQGVLPAGDDGASLIIGEAGLATLTIPGVDFNKIAAQAKYAGMHIILSGFSDESLNGNATIIGNVTNSLTLLNSNFASKDNGSEFVLETAGTYKTLIGAGPSPADVSFFDSEAIVEEGKEDKFKQIAITKPEMTKDSPAIDVKLKTNGFGFALAADSTQPHGFPTEMVDGKWPEASYGCKTKDVGEGDDAKTVCDVKGEAAPLTGIITFGETTDGELSDNLSDFAKMPAPVKKYATWQCSGLNKTSIALDSKAVGLIMGTNPTRIQTSVTYGNADLKGDLTIVVSNGFVGWTDMKGNTQ